MNLYFADRLLDIKGMGSTAVNSPYQVINDTISDEIETGIKILEFDIRYKEYSEISNLKSMMTEGNYILYDGILGQTCFTMVEVEHDPIEKNYHIYAEDAGLDLINETRSGLSAPNDGPKPITWYTERILSNDWEIGINEIPNDKEMTLSWESDMTSTELLSSLASYFGAEITYRFVFSGLFITKKYLDIYKKRGKEVYQELRLGREIENIVEKRSITNLATALNPVGSSIEVGGETSDPITLDGETYDDGDFYIDGRILRSRTALERWGRYNVRYGYNSDYTVRTFNYETSDKVALRNAAIEELKKRREPEVTYQVSLLYLPENLGIGDTVYLVDDHSELYLQARMLKIEISESNDTRTAEFGDYVVKKAGILERFETIANDIKAGIKPKYTWIAYADSLTGSGISDSPTGKYYIGIAANMPDNTPILDPTLYAWSLRDNVVSEWESYSDYSSGDTYYTIETDQETGDQYVVINGSDERYLIQEDTHGYQYYTNSKGQNVYIGEGILVPMSEEEYNDYVDEQTSAPGIYFVYSKDEKKVRVVSEKVNTEELYINGVSIADYITSQVGYTVRDYTYTYSIAADGIVNLTASQLQISTPTGYSPVAVLSARSGDGRVVIRTFNGAATSSGQALCLRNTSSDALSNLEAHLTILYFSTSLEGGGSGGGGGGGTTDYNALTNKPSIDEVTLQGNRDLYLTNTEIDNLINQSVNLGT